MSITAGVSRSKLKAWFPSGAFWDVTRGIAPHARAGASSAHWSDYTGKQRLIEMMGRMNKVDGVDGRTRLEKFLLHGMEEQA